MGTNSKIAVHTAPKSVRLVAERDLLYFILVKKKSRKANNTQPFVTTRLRDVGTRIRILISTNVTKIWL